MAFQGLNWTTRELEKHFKPYRDQPLFGSFEDTEGRAWKLGVLSVNTTPEGVCLILGEMQPPLPPEGKA